MGQRLAVPGPIRRAHIAALTTFALTAAAVLLPILVGGSLDEAPRWLIDGLFFVPAGAAVCGFGAWIACVFFAFRQLGRRGLWSLLGAPAVLVLPLTAYVFLALHRYYG